jgi:hypothetical protein
VHVHCVHQPAVCSPSSCLCIHTPKSAQFGRLERIEVGGTKGKVLTAAIKQVHADFLATHERLQRVRACVLLHGENYMGRHFLLQFSPLTHY